MKSDQMYKAYLEAAVFTDCGDIDQPPSDAEFSDQAIHEARTVCHRFNLANSDLIGGNYEQAGHDLWFSRNGHGTGFWDRPEIWGEHGDTLHRCAETLGPRSVYVDEETGKLEFDLG